MLIPVELKKFQQIQHNSGVLVWGCVLYIQNVIIPVLQVSFPVDYTPRKFVIHHESAHLIITETEHNAYTEDTKKQRRIQMAEVWV